MRHRKHVLIGGVMALVLMGLLLAASAPGEARGPRVVFDVGVPVWIGPSPWWGPPVYAYPAAPPVVVQQSPVYETPAAPPAVWYYCPNPSGYYPYVQQCPAGWMHVVPQSAPPGR